MLNSCLRIHLCKPLHYMDQFLLSETHEMSRSYSSAFLHLHNIHFSVLIGNMNIIVSICIFLAIHVLMK
jgi:hypothetical protein